MFKSNSFNEFAIYLDEDKKQPKTTFIGLDREIEQQRRVNEKESKNEPFVLSLNFPTRFNLMLLYSVATMYTIVWSSFKTWLEVRGRYTRITR